MGLILTPPEVARRPTTSSPSTPPRPPWSWASGEGAISWEGVTAGNASGGRAGRAVDDLPPRWRSPNRSAPSSARPICRSIYEAKSILSLPELSWRSPAACQAKASKPGIVVEAVARRRAEARRMGRCELSRMGRAVTRSLRPIRLRGRAGATSHQHGIVSMCGVGTSRTTVAPTCSESGSAATSGSPRRARRCAGSSCPGRCGRLPGPRASPGSTWGPAHISGPPRGAVARRPLGAALPCPSSAGRTAVPAISKG